MDNEVKKLYSALIGKGYTTRDLGDEQTFMGKMQDADNRKQLYDWVNARGDFRIGSYEDYEKRLTAPPAPKAEDINPTSDKSGYTFTAEELDKKLPRENWGAESIASPRLPEIKPMEVALQSPYKTNYEQAKAAGDTRSYEEWLESLPKAYNQEDAVGANGELKAFIPKEKIKSEEYGGLSREQAEFLRTIGHNDDVDAVKALNKTTVRDQVNESFQEITDAWNTVRGKVNEEYYGDRWYGRPLQAINKAFFNTDATDFTTDKGVQSLRAADKLIGEAKSVMDAATEGKGFFAGTGEALSQWNPVKSLEGLVDADAIEAVVRKVEQGKELSRAESALLDAFALNAAAHSYYEDEVSNWYNAGKVVGDMIPLAAEMAANPASGMARKWAQATLKRVAGKSLSKATKKALIYAAGAGGAFAGGATMAGTTGLPSVLEEAQKNTTGQALFGINKSGEVGFTGVKEGGSFGEEFLKSLYRRGVENATEQMGAEWLTKWLGGVAGKAVKAIPGGKKAVEYVTDLVDNKYAHYLKELADKVNYQGPIEEFVEEIESAVLGVPVDGMDSLKEFFDGDNLITTAIAVSVPGFGMGAINAIGGVATGRYKVGYKENHKRMQAFGRGMEAFGDNQREWSNIAFKINTSSVDAVEEELKRIYHSPDYTDEQKQRVLEYAVHSLKYRTLVEAKTAMADDTTKMLNDMLGSRYSEGYEVADEQKGVVKQAYDMERERVLNTFGEELVQRLDDDPIGALMELNEVARQEAIDYVNARTAYEGMIDRISDDIDERIKASDKEIDSHMNKQDGMIHPAVMRGENGAEPKKVYIVGGNVATREDGTIDKANSSSMIIVRDAETGEVSAASADDLESLDAVIDAETEKKSVAEQIANEYAGQQAAIIETENENAEGENGVAPVAVPGDEQTQPVAQTALERVPKAENGEPVYEQADAETAWDAIMEQTNDEELATQVVEGMIADKEAALKKLENSKVREGVTVAEKIAAAQQRKAAIEKAKADLAKWQEIAGVKAKRETAAVESAPVVEETQAPVVESAPVEDNTPQSQSDSSPILVEQPTPQATNEMQEADLEKGEKDEVTDAPSLLDVVKTLYSKGKEVASKLFQRSFFDVAKTPKFMQELGLRGEKFTIKYGVIARHLGKDSSHTLTEKDWEQLPQALQNPFAISKLTDKKDSYRIYTTLQTESGEFVVVGADVKNAGREIEVNAISTVFGRRNNANLPKNEDVIYRSKEITPEQSSLLERPNFAQYPTEQELSTDEGTTQSAKVQENTQESGETAENGGESASAKTIFSSAFKDLVSEGGKYNIRITKVDGAKRVVTANINTANIGGEGLVLSFEEMADILNSGNWQEKIAPKPTNPSGNKLVTDERYNELKERMKKKLKGQMNIGVDPEILAIGTEMAVYHIEKGARKFADFAKGMIADLGDAIRPYLKAFYNGARELPEIEEAGFTKDMTPYEEVKTFDVANFDKLAVDAMATAETVTRETEVAKDVEAVKAPKKRESAEGKKLRKATQEDLEGNPVVYYKGEKHRILMLVHRGEQTSGARFTKPEITRVYLENMQDVKVEDLYVEDTRENVGESGDNSVPSQQTPVNNLNENNDGREENTATDNSGAQPGREELPDTEQVGAGVPVQDTARNSKRKRRNAGVGSSELGNGPQYDVNRNYTNEEIETIVSSVTDIVDGKVVITGEVTDDIKAIVRGYESGGIAKKGRGILDEYYTDGKIVDAVNLLIAPYFSGSTPIRVLEPSVGIGNFIQAVNNIPISEVVAFEINETTARIAKILYPDVDVNLRSFETEFIDESGNKKPMPQKYSLVIGNPPYGSHRGLYKGLGEESKIARYEDYFVKRSLDVLDEGGVLAMVLPSSWMDRHTKFGGYTIERAYRLPSGAFEATQVGTDIVILKKDSSVPVTEHAPYFEQFPERVLGEVKQRKGRYGRLEEYVEGDIDAAIEAIKKENAEQVADLLDIEKNNDALNDIESAVDETGSPEKAVAIVKDAQESEKADKKPAKKPSGKQGKYKAELNRGVETVPTSAQFTHEFSEGEVEAFADTDYEGALSNPAKHRRYANYIGGQAIHDFYYAEGDIYSKLAQLEQEKDYIVENYGVEQYEKQKALLESVLPKQKSLEEITISPNTTFVKNLNILTEGGRISLKDMFVDFLRKLPRQAFGNSSSWEVVGYINNEQVHGTDKQRNQLIRERRKRVANDLFNKFLSEELSDNAKKQVVAAFNREYNSTYRPDYSKVPMFSTINRDFKGKPLKLTSVQLAGIGRMTVKGVGVLAHEVGFGKTLSGILAMHEAMTRGFAKKPLIVVPNDNILKQWVETIGEVLPNATVNTLGNLGAGYDLTDFKVNDGEFTIITYEGLKAMSFSDYTYEHLASKFSYITEDLNKHQSERDIQKEIEKKNELKGKMKRGTKPTYLFEDFGFDWLTVDEVHNANHIVSKVRLDKSVASDFRSQSQRTSDLGLKTWLAAQYIQEENNGRNVLLLSATPFTNKPLEYYSILSLVGNDMLERKGFFNVDQFFATFMEADNELEIGANGRPMQKTNVRRFRNNGLFQQLLSEFIDIKGEEDNPELVRPERLNKEYKIAQNELTAEAMAAAQELLSDNDTVLQGIGHARAAAFSPYATSLLGRQPKNHVEFVRNSPKIDATIKMIEQNIKDRPDAGQIIYSEVGVEYFPLIRDYLVKESGLKPSEVRIITGATSNNERVNIQTAFNNGEVKVVIGSPAIKEGLNLQGNTTDMYILSLPWNFTQLRQIEGRGWRQGNRWENIRINYMLTNDSVDVFMLQRLQLKQGLYNEAMKSGAESLDVSDIDTAELKTALITDPAVRAEIVTVQEREKLQLEKTQIEADLSFVMRKYEAYNKLVEKLGSQKNTIKMYREWAKKGDEYWAQRIPREEAQLANIENEIEEEKQSLLKKGVNVDDIVRQTEQAQNAIAAIQEKIDNLKEFQEELTQKFREESEAKAKEQGDLVSTYIKERKAENKGGFYKIRPDKSEAKALNKNVELSIAEDAMLQDRGTEAFERATKVTMEAVERLKANGLDIEVVSEEEANEMDANRVSPLRTTDGKVYGWAVDGKIRLTPDGINPDTPVHEYAHLWGTDVEKNNPKLWNKVVDAMKLSPVWNEVANDANYSDIHGNDSRMASEVLARLSGRENYRRTMEQAEKEIANANGVFEMAERISSWAKVKAALKNFWNWVQRNVFHTEPMDWQDFVDDVVGRYYGVSKVQRLQERIGSLARDVLNAVFKQSGIDIDLAEPVNVEQVAVVETESRELETENGERQTENGSISSVGTEENGSQAASEPQARNRNMDREAWKKAFKKGGEKAYDLMYELHGGVVSRFPQEFLVYLKGVVGVPSDVANVVEAAHNYLVLDFKNKNPELFKVEDAPAVSDVHSLLATKGYSLLEHTMDNGKAIGVKMMYRDKFVPSGQTDTSYTPEGWHGRTVICYYNDPDSRLHQQYVFTVTKNNATETPTAYELAADPSLMTPEWAEYLEKTGRKNEDGSYNLEGLQPDFSDPFSLSHLMIRIGKTSGDVEIISRYNHGAFDANGEYQQIAGQPNATLDGNLNKLASGLYGALADYKNIKPQDVMLEEGVKIANDGKVYRFTRMAGDIYVGDGFWIKDDEAHVVDRNKERMVGDLVVGKDYVYDIRKNIKIPVRKAAVIDGGIEFYTGGEAVTEIREIEVNGEKRTVEKTTWKGSEKTTLKDNVLTTEITDGELLTNVARMARPDEIVATDIKEVGDDFLNRLAPLDRVEMPNLERVGDYAFSRTRVALYSFPKLREVGDGFMPGCTSFFGIEFPSLEKVGDEFMLSAGTFGIADVVVTLPKLREVGDGFLQSLSVKSVVFKSLEVAGDGFLQNAVVKTIGTPELRQVGENFMSENANKVEAMVAPKLENVPADFMAGNAAVRESIEEQRQEYLEEQQESEETMFSKKITYDEAVQIGNDFAKTHKGAAKKMVFSKGADEVEQQMRDAGFTEQSIQVVLDNYKSGDLPTASYFALSDGIVFYEYPTEEEVNTALWHENAHRAINMIYGDDLSEVKRVFDNLPEKQKDDFIAFLKKFDYAPEDYPEESVTYVIEGAYMDGAFADGDYDITRFFKGAGKNAEDFINFVQQIINYTEYGQKETRNNSGVNTEEHVQEQLQERNTEGLEEGTGASETATGGLTEEEITMLEASTGYTREEIIDMFGYELNRSGAGPLTDREVVMESDPYSKVLGKPRYYGKRQREFVARQRRRMAEKARQVAERLNLNNVEVLGSTEGLTGKKATSKGWFDPRTGKITVVVPNHGSTGDIVETVLHEAVAHYGLRKLFGENFKNFLDNVYRNVTPEIRAEITELAKKHGWDFHTATEEYLASLAENTNFERVNPSLWSNIKSFFMKMLAKVGITLDEPLGDNELRYILWRSHQNLVNPGWFNVFGQAEDIAKQYELGVGNYASGEVKTENGEVAAEDEIRFREGGAPGSAREEYERKVRRPNKSGSVGATENVARRAQEAYQDSMLALKILQDAVARETGNEVKDNENAYIAENRMSSSNKAMVEIYERDFFMPLMDEINALIKEGVEYDDIIRYLHAKHGLERNEYMRRKQAEEAARRELGEEPAMPNEGDADYEAKVNAKAAWRANLAELTESYVKKFAKRDYSGLTALTETANAKDAEAAAQQMVDEFENDHDTTPLWEAVNKATKETLRREFVGGLIDRATYDTVSTMFDFYIPLRGWDENVAANEYEYFTNNNTPVFTPAIKTMHGRKSLSDDPIATIGYMAGSAIARANRNLMKQKFLNFVMNNPTSLATVNEQWYTMDYGTNEWVPNNPAIPEDATPEQVVEIVEAHEANMRALEKAGKATRERSGLKIGLHATKQEQQQHVVRVMRNGKEYAVYINGNPRAAQALNGMTNPDASKSKAREAAQAVKNFMARAFTSRNPAFIISNSVRDVIWAGTAVAAKEDAEYTKQYTKNVTGVLAKFKLPRLLRKFQKGTLDMNDEIERYFDEFLRNGGETGFTQVLTVEDYKKNIARFTKEAKNGTRISKKAWRGLWNGIEFLNRSAEDITRFTVYMTSRQMGRSIERSVYDAKEITVNFNKKGSGEMGARYLNFAYIFFNATIQSLANFGKLIYRHLGKMAAALGTFGMMGFLMPVINAALMALGDDDDEENYWNLPEWVRRNNIVLFVPWTEKGFITIPLPHELRPFYGMGENAMSALLGKQSTEDAIKKSLVGFTGMLPIDFTANGGDVVVNLMPTILQPLAQVRANVTHFGTPIYKDNDFNKRYPSWTKAYKGTNSTLVAATKWLNELGGGNDVDSGGLLDWNPAVIEHLFESYLGGMGKTFNKAATTVSMLWDEDARIARNIPVASSFYQEGDERTAGSQLNREYFDALEEMEGFQHRMSGYQKQITKGNAEYEKLFEDLVNSDEFMRYSIIKDYSNAIRELDQVLKNNGPTEEEAQEIEGVIQELKKEMLDELEKLQAEE